ncbi:MAG: tetratricopeptide repeat protein [Bacteroidota bacterium]
MRKTKFLLTFIAATALLAGCINTQMPEDYAVEPNPLEVHGNTVDVKVSGTIPEKSFHKKAVVKFTPVLRFDNQEKQLEPMTLKGEDVEEVDGKVINSKEGGKVEYTDSFEWDPDMKAAELYVTAEVTKNDDTESFPDNKVADGVIMTSKRVAKSGEVSIADHGYEKETIVKESGNIYYDYNRSNLNWNLDLNENNEEEMDQLKSFMERGWELEKLNIDAWASPEGELSLNEELSEERADVAKDFIVDWYEDKSKEDDNKIEYDEVEEEINFNVEAKGEDYDGFMKALQASDIEEKNTIANVIKSQASKSEREQRIKDMTVIYEEIEEMLEVLRRAEITIFAYEPKLTDEEIAEFATTNPDSLSKKEILYAATLTNNMEAKHKIYEGAVEVYPDSWKAHNNLAAVLLEMGKEDKAAEHLERANTLQPNNGHIANNMGVLAAWKKDYESAADYYSTAKEHGINTSYNTATLKIINGNYSAALSAYQDVECEYNKALALLMDEQTNEATQVLDCADETARKHYLMAVIGARTDNDNMLYTNLKKAINMDESYKEKASYDREFIDYFEKEDFTEIVK